MRSAIVALSALLIAGCSRATTSLPVAPNVANAQARPLTGSTFSSLYAFAGSPDGAVPVSNVTTLSGTLYGTTSQGGSGTCGSTGCGTVFAISPSGSEHVVYDFAGGTDGADPQAGLTSLNGRLYGTTRGGGSKQNYGTVFELITSGERVLHRFTGKPDGENPYATLLFYNGLFYGTTYGGGAHKSGTVFTVNRSGQESVLYSFKGGSDGASPLGGLIAVGGTLYGTTAGGGAHTGGTVYSLTTAGKETVLYSFKGGTDGLTPSTTLVYAGGSLYGTTVYGGTASQSNGTVFAVTLKGKESVLYRFQGGSDGASPFGNLVSVKGTFYGTTYFGGSGGASGHGNGTIYEITKAGAEVRLHLFQGGSDGGNPAAGLYYSNRTLYGTSSEAGLSQASGDGTAFSLSI
jgi:uncharacterized repeat protein (TIGR03803 family)